MFQRFRQFLTSNIRQCSFINFNHYQYSHYSDSFFTNKTWIIISPTFAVIAAGHNSEIISILESKHNNSTHSGWKRPWQNVKALPNKLDKKNIISIASQVPVHGYPFYFVWKHVWGYYPNGDEEELQCLNLFADWLCEKVPKFTEHTECIRELRQGTWFSTWHRKHSKPAFHGFKKKKNKRIYDRLSHIYNIGSYQIQSSSSNVKNDGSKLCTVQNKPPTLSTNFLMSPVSEWITDNIIQYFSEIITISERQKNILITNKINGSQLKELNHCALQSLGIDVLGDRLQILKAISSLPSWNDTINESMSSWNDTNTNNSNSFISGDNDTNNINIEIINECESEENIGNSKKNNGKLQIAIECAKNESNTDTNSNKYFSVSSKKKSTVTKSKKWWDTFEGYNDDTNKQMRRMMRYEWGHEISKCDAYSLGVIVLGLKGEAQTQSEIRKFVVEKFPNVSMAKTTGLLLPSRTSSATVGGNGVYAFAESKIGKCLEKCVNETIKNNSYLSEMRAVIESETKKGKTNCEQTENISEDETEETNESEVSQANGRKRKYSVGASALSNLSISENNDNEPPMKKQKI